MSLFKVIQLNKTTFNKIKKVVKDFDVSNPAHTMSGYHPSIRNCLSCAIPAQSLNSIIFPIIQKINVEEEWNFKLVDPNGYSFNRYEKGNFYTWHKDGHLNDKPTYVRKVSFSLGMSSDYTGGDFLIEAQRRGAEKELKYNKFHLKEGEMIVFKSDLLHCVKEVESGTRDSLVGWIYGPRSWNL